MESENEINDELKNIGANIPVKIPHEPPAGYFEKLPGVIISRWKQEGHYPQRETKWFSRFAIAAIITGLLIAGWFVLAGPASKQSDKITALEAYQYIDENIGDFENIIETLEIIPAEFPNDIPHEAIEDYLLEETEETTPEDLF